MAAEFGSADRAVAGFPHREAVRELHAPFLPTGGNQRYCTSCRSTHETPQMQLRKKLDRIADLAADAHKMTPTMLRIRIQAVYDGVNLPAEEDDFLKLAARAASATGSAMQHGASSPSERPEPLTADQLELAKTLAKARSFARHRRRNHSVPSRSVLLTRR